MSNKPNKQQPHNLGIVHQSFYQGQLPPPEMMEQYGRIDPDMPNKIMKMAIDEAAHRHFCEKKTTRAFSISAIMGMIFAFLSVIIVSGIVVYALNLGYPTQAAAIATGVIVGLAGVFLFRRYGKKQQ